jgi:hypothetical protein
MVIGAIAGMAITDLSKISVFQIDLRWPSFLLIEIPPLSFSSINDQNAAPTFIQGSQERTVDAVSISRRC